MKHTTATEPRAGFIEKSSSLNEIQRSSDDSLIDIEQELSKLQAIFSDLPAGLILIDGDGYVREYNQRATEFLGIPLANELWSIVIKRAFAPRSDDGHEISLRDGRRLHISTKALTLQAGQLILLHDLTATRELQARVNQQQRLLAMGKMVASIAHQIRTPLSSAILYASNMANQRIDVVKSKTFARKILSRLQNVEGQIRDMLLFAQGGSSALANITIKDIIEQLNARIETQLQQHDAKLVIAKDISEKEILCNQESILSVLENLVNNSLEATEKNSIINIGTINKDDVVSIIIRDNGPGIPMQLHQKVFEPFYTLKTNGTGLGLAVVKAVIEAHQGKVDINSEFKSGCEVVISLPEMVQRNSGINKKIEEEIGSVNR